MHLKKLKIYEVISFIILFLLLSCSEGGKESHLQSLDYKLVWFDEFDGEEIDTTKWSHEVNAFGGGNNELQYYTSRKENSFVKNGMLTIRALRETYTEEDATREFTSARLRTKNKGDWKCGRFEVRAKLPYGRGFWPAIWMLPTEWEYGGWAASGEIDIMELLGQDTKKIYGTLHYGGEYPNNTHTGDSLTLAEGDFSQEFHNFSIEWEPTEIRWYVDGIFYQTQTNWYSDSGDYPAPFNKEFHVILNVAVGGNWPGYPDSTTVFPQDMLVDYVRVYQKE